MAAETPDPKKVLHNVKSRVRARLENAKRATEGTNPPGQNFKIFYSSVEAQNTFFKQEGGIAAYIHQRLAHSDTGRPLHILEYGSGANKLGRDLKNIFGAKITFTGISAGDPRSPEDKILDKNLGIDSIQQSTTTLPPTDKADLILSVVTFVHLPDPLRTLKQLYSRLADGGELRADCCLGDLAEAFRDYDNFHANLDAEATIRRLQRFGIDIQMNTERTIIRKHVNSPRDLPLEKIFSYSGVDSHRYGRVKYTLKPE